MRLPYFAAGALLPLAMLSGLRGQDSDAFKPIFNGHDLSGWQPVGVAADTFSVRDGMVIVTGSPAGFLRTDRQYENFVLECDWQFTRSASNSGVLIWTDGLPAVGAPFPKGFEVQVLDPGYDKLHADGANVRFTSQGDIFGIRGGTMSPAGKISPNGKRSFPSEARTRPSPEWNHYRIECNNGEIHLSVNGKEVTVAKNCLPRKGYVCLESEDGEAHFKNIRLKELPDTPLQPESVANTYAGYVPLSDGADLAGWKLPEVAKKTWHAEGTHILAADADTPRSAGEPDLWTERNYKDFEMIADWRLTMKPVMRSLPTFTPDGLFVKDADGKVVRKPILNAGDSGIYLRGNPRYQVNIWSQPMGSGDINELHKDPAVPIEIRQAAVPKLRADAPFGQWNRFYIRLQGDRLTVVLNGKTIIENAKMLGIPADGPIGLQHEFHGSPVEFTNLFVRELK